MCGINGIWSLTCLDNFQKRIMNMNDSIAHRGPDAQGIYIKENRLAFGHRRLSIIDVDTRANQPMCSDSKRFVVVFNGEIYNYAELKKQTKYPYKSNSDTEVILAYIEEFGIDEFLQRCNGMFAIALYDAAEQKVYLFRDRMGIKPLYYYYNGNCLLFSSEIKGILNSGLVEAKFNDKAIDDYLAYRYVREPNTFFQNIFQVEAGTYLEFNNQLMLHQKKYWEIPVCFNQDKKYQEEEIADSFETVLCKSIKDRLVSDVPLGTYLSGGIDSSLITAITAKLKGSLNTYTIGFKNENEFYYSDLVANKYHTKHTKIVVDKESYFEQISKTIYYKDAPLGVPNEVLLAQMSRILKKNITVVLSGEGADELMGGYGRIFRLPYDFLNVDAPQDDFYNYFTNKYEYVPRKLRDMMLDHTESYREAFDERIKRNFDSNCNEYNMFWFFHKYHIKGLLQRLDTTTMLAGVEARVPFLDYKLIEFSYTDIPYDLKMKWNSEYEKQKAASMHSNEYSEVMDTPKYLLKRVAGDYLPQEIISRKKIGFPVPLNEWWKEEMEQAEELLKKAGWLKYNNINLLIDRIGQYEKKGQIIWMLNNLALFYNLYFEKEWRY